MSYAILPAVGAMVLFGTADFLTKKALEKGNNAYVIFFYSFSIATILFGVLAATQSAPMELKGPLPLYSSLMAVLLFISTIAVLAALKVGEASIVIPIGRMGFIVTALCAFIFLGEKLTLTRGLGLIAAVAALILLSKKRKILQETKMFKRAYILLALIGMIFMGLVDYLSKIALNLGIHFISLMFFMYIFTAALLGIYCLLKKYPMKMGKSVTTYSIAIGLLAFAGSALALIALKNGSASVIIPIIRLGFVVTAICAFIFLREKITLQKGLGILCAVISLVLLSQ